MSKNTGLPMRFDPALKQSPAHAIIERDYMPADSPIIIIAGGQRIAELFVQIHLKESHRDRKYIIISSRWDFRKLRAISPKKVYLAYKWYELYDGELMLFLSRFKDRGALLFEWDYGHDEARSFEIN